MRIYAYNDLRGFSQKTHNVKSNLCTHYYADKKKFCGNYCSRKGIHGHQYNRRCWRHKRFGMHSARLPPVILLMISSSERFYNREIWQKFLTESTDKGVPFELVVYHEDMSNCTVRNPQNLISRFRPFPDLFGNVLPLRGAHGSLNFTQIYLKMLEYACKIPFAARCVVLTERTIPIRDPVRVYKRVISSKCYLDVSYNVGYGPLPDDLPKGQRNKPFAAVNNLCQGLFTTEFLKKALPTVPMYCHKFGISLDNGVYRITDRPLFEKWRSLTGSNPSEFFLLNSFLIDIHGKVERPIEYLKTFMDATIENDRYTVAEIPQWRDGWKRTYVFKDMERKESIPRFNESVSRYYRGLDLNEVSLREIIYFIKKNKSKALFFRQVELP